MSYNMLEDKEGIIDQLAGKLYDVYASTLLALGHNILPTWKDTRGTPEGKGWFEIAACVAKLMDSAAETMFKSVGNVEPATLWENDKVQFARVIDELQALGIPDDVQFRQLQESTDLKRSELKALLGRAALVWECAKRDV